MPFQTRVNNFNPPAVEGDFASVNPRSSVLAGPGGLVAGLAGAIVGRFHWVGPDLVSADPFATGPVAPDGFLHRAQQALIQVYLAEYSMLVPAGFQIDLSNGGDYWVKNMGPAAMVKGSTVYAGYADGRAYTSAPTGASATGSIGSTNTAALGSTSTGTAVVGNPEQITLSSVTGVVSINDFVAGTGVPIGTQIVAQISGTVGGAGVYETSQPVTASAATITTYGNVLVVSASTGLISIGDTVAGVTGLPVGTTITAQVSGTAGGAGTYSLSAPGTAYFASATGVTTFGNVLKVTAVASGVLQPGMPITGTNMPATSIQQQLTPVNGAGGVGTYQLFLPATQYVASEAFTTAGGIDSGWKAYPTNLDGDGAVGSLVKISKQPQ